MQNPGDEVDKLRDEEVSDSEPEIKTEDEILDGLVSTLIGVSCFSNHPDMKATLDKERDIFFPDFFNFQEKKSYEQLESFLHQVSYNIPWVNERIDEVIFKCLELIEERERPKLFGTCVETVIELELESPVKLRLLEKLVKFKNDSIHDFIETSLPLMKVLDLATREGNLNEIIKLFLLNGADPVVAWNDNWEDYRDRIVQVLSPLERPKQWYMTVEGGVEYSDDEEEIEETGSDKEISSLVKMLESARLLNEAVSINLSPAVNYLKAQIYFLQACQLDIDYVIDYLEFHINRANLQTVSEEKIQDYRFLLKFIRYFHESFHSQPEYKEKYTSFQNRIVLELIGHDFGQPNSLFETKKEKDDFFSMSLETLLKQNPVCNRFLEQTKELESRKTSPASGSSSSAKQLLPFVKAAGEEGKGKEPAEKHTNHEARNSI